MSGKKNPNMRRSDAHYQRLAKAGKRRSPWASAPMVQTVENVKRHRRMHGGDDV